MNGQKVELGNACREKVLDVRLRSMKVLNTGRAVLLDNAYMECGCVMRCYQGRFRLSFNGRPPVEIGEGEAIVTYSNHRISSEALMSANQLFFVVFDGTEVDDWFDSFNFYDGIHGHTTEQREVFESVKRRLDAGENPLTLLSEELHEALVTYSHDLQEGGNVVLGEAIRLIRRNIQQGIVRLDPLCRQLGISRAYLYTVFVEAGFGPPSAFIRAEQLRLVIKLLRNTREPIAEVARMAGFISPTHFSNFMRRYTGKSARELRFGKSEFSDNESVDR